MWKIYKSNSQDLNFALACLYCQAIDLDEFKLWVERVIISMAVDNIPFYIFDLLDFNEPLSNIYETIGFVTDNELSEKDELAIYGIAFSRGIDVYDPPITKEESLKYLNENSFIYNEFKRFFPNINIGFSINLKINNKEKCERF